MLTFLVIIINVVVMGFLICCAIVDYTDRDNEFEKLGPKELIWFFIVIWILGCMAGAL